MLENIVSIRNYNMLSKQEKELVCRDERYICKTNTTMVRKVNNRLQTE